MLCACAVLKLELELGAGVEKGSVDRNPGFCLALVTASNPDANLIRVGSLNAEAKNDIPTGTPKTIPAGTLMFG